MSSEFKLKDGSWFLSMVVPQNYDKNGNATSVLIANLFIPQFAIA